MNILVLTTSYPTGPGDAGGIFIRYLVGALARRGHGLRVVAPQGPATGAVSQADGAGVWRFRYGLRRRCPGLTAIGGGIPEALRRSRWARAQLPAMLAGFVAAGLAHAGWADVIYANWLGAGLAGAAVRMCTGLPMVITLRGDDAYLVRDRLLWRYVGRWVLGQCSAVTVVSENMVDLIGPHLPPRLRPAIVPTFGVDTVRFCPPPAGRGEPAGGADGLFVGNVSRAKGVDILLEALAHRSGDWGRFVFIGSGPDAEQMQDLARRLGLGDRIEWSGQRDPDDVARQMRLSDFLVLPSLSEGRPNVVMEAMASSLAVIATAVGGVGDIVADGTTGLLVQPGQVAGLADAIGRICTNATLRGDLARQGRRHIERNDLTWSRTAREFEEIFARATGAGALRGAEQELAEHQQ